MQLGGQPPDAPRTAYEERSATARPGCRVLREVRTASGTPFGPGSYHSSAWGAADFGCHAAVTSAVYCPAPQPGLLVAGSLDGIVRVWR